MKPYLLIGLTGAVIGILLDRFLGTRLINNKKFWKLQVLAAILAVGVDSYLSGRPIVIFNPQVILGLRIGYIPIENFIFGFDLIYINLILFEFFKRDK